MTKCDRSHEVPFSVGRRQFLGYTGAGMLAAVLPGCGNGDIQSTPYQQTIALGQQMIQQAVSDPSNPVAAISIAMVKGNTVRSSRHSPNSRATCCTATMIFAMN
ncbi:TAT (twin-arginine translocation) pathway-exported protein [Paraburkholderia sp. BL27I4N3]|uniref:hypothetical protein n=1 Tax=Paraburkholderia sp. BL27I4N3 TaxID=1938805 RepID=UPI000E39CA8A|nr:hypothetical protein [Paraburkholderia sp. BL27I4N3]REE21411.1 TAT (twin-arginine translocation) pathway-exported protein [Paraburkholderia sp. BL27I4N3]